MPKCNQYEILIQNLCVEAIIGILPSEREIPQRVLIDASVCYVASANLASCVDFARIDSSDLSSIDSIATNSSVINSLKLDFANNKFLDYTKLVESIAYKLKSSKYDLLENALDDIIFYLKDSYPSITKIDLSLKKPDIFAAKSNYANQDFASTNLSKDFVPCLDYVGCILGVRKTWEC